MYCRSAIVLVVVAILLSGAPASTQQDEREREAQQRVNDILRELMARDGAHIGDIGSSDGFYSIRIAKAVAPSGRAYAVDIDATSLDKLRARAAQEDVRNIEVIHGDAADPKLPPGTLDAVLIRNTYHEMTEHRSILQAVKTALKPGGILVVSESIHEKNRPLSRDQQVKEHEIAPEVVEAELREAGFTITKRDDAFTKFTRAPSGGFWLIVARRP